MIIIMHMVNPLSGIILVIELSEQKKIISLIIFGEIDI